MVWGGGIAGVSAAALPLTHDVCTLGDQIGGTPGVEIGERRSEAGGELADLVPAAQWLMQGVFEADVGCGEFVDDGGGPSSRPRTR